VALVRTEASSSVLHLLVTADVPSSPTLVALMMEAMHFSETSVLGPHGVMFQETAFFIIIAMKTSNHRYIIS
jgi:hypothetical protein